MDEERAHHQMELTTLEEQVRQALGLKDAFIESLQQKLDTKSAELETMHKLLCDSNQTLNAS